MLRKKLRLRIHKYVSNETNLFEIDELRNQSTIRVLELQSDRIVSRIRCYCLLQHFTALQNIRKTFINLQSEKSILSANIKKEKFPLLLRNTNSKRR